MTNIITFEEAVARKITPAWYRRATSGGVVHLLQGRRASDSSYGTLCRLHLGTAEQLEEGPYEKRCADCLGRLNTAIQAVNEPVPSRVTTSYLVTITRNTGTADPAEHIARRLAAMRSWEIEVQSAPNPDQKDPT